MQQAVGELVRQATNHFFRVFAAGKPRQGLLLGKLAQLHGLVTEAADQFAAVANAPLVQPYADAVLDQRFRLVRGRLTMAAVLLDDLVEVVHGVEKDVVEVADFRLDVARHSDIDHEDGAVAALLERPFGHALAENGKRRRGGGDDDIGAHQGLGDLVQRDRLGIELLRQHLGPLAGAVGHDHVAHPGLAQMARHQLNGLAGADQQRPRASEVVEDAAGQAHRGIGHRYRVLADTGAGAHLLGYREGVLKQQLQLAAEPAGLSRRLVGALELTENLRLAQHHRIEPHRDAHQVAGCFPIAIVIGAGVSSWTGRPWNWPSQSRMTRSPLSSVTQ